MPSRAYEPTNIEIMLTLGLGLTILSPYYRAFVDSLNLQGDERVLDFGSGSGVCSRHIAARLQKHGGHLDCVDISRKWNSVIRRTLWRYRNYVGFHLGDINTLDLPDEAYDVVVVHYVLHNIPSKQRAQVVSKLVDKLKPAGRLLLREPIGQFLGKGELLRLADQSFLHTASLTEHKVAIGDVYDANFIDVQPIPVPGYSIAKTDILQPVAC